MRQRDFLAAQYERLQRGEELPAVEFFVVRLPAGRAQGAEDSRRGHLKAKPGKGQALRGGVPETASKPGPKKRNRLTGAQRKGKQRVEDARFAFIPKDGQRPRPKRS